MDQRISGEAGYSLRDADERDGRGKGVQGMTIMSPPKFCDHGVPFYGPPAEQKCMLCEINWYKRMLAYALEDVYKARRSLIKRGMTESEVDALVRQSEHFRSLINLNAGD